MAGRIRSIKPEWLEDEKLAAASDEARTLSVGLLLLADDHGCGRAHPSFILSQVWAYSRDPRESLAKVSRALAELSAIGFCQLYDVGGQRYFFVRNWAKHQKVDHPGKPRVPGPTEGQHVDAEALKVSAAASVDVATFKDTSTAPPPPVKPVAATEAPRSPEPWTMPLLDLGPAVAAKVDPADVVFATWLEGWRAHRAEHHITGGVVPTLPPDDKRRNKVGKIMSPKGGARTLDQLVRAARGIWLSAWRREDPSVRAKFVFVVDPDDLERVDGFIADADAGPVAARASTSVHDRPSLVTDAPRPQPFAFGT